MLYQKGNYVYYMAITAESCIEEHYAYYWKIYTASYTYSSLIINKWLRAIFCIYFGIIELFIYDFIEEK